MRLPAWCDRVLWRVSPSAAPLVRAGDGEAETAMGGEELLNHHNRKETQPLVRQLSYWRAEQRTSDHKPVLSELIIQVS